MYLVHTTHIPCLHGPGAQLSGIQSTGLPLDRQKSENFRICQGILLKV